MRTNVLKVEPACRRACATRLNWFLRLFGVTAAMARIAPFRGLMATSAAAGSPRSFSVSRIDRTAARWKRGSIVV